MRRGCALSAPLSELSARRGAASARWHFTPGEMAYLFDEMQERIHAAHDHACCAREQRRTVWHQAEDCRANRQTADHGRLPCAPFDSGNIANMRRASGRRPSFAAVLRSERTSTGCQPCAVKKGGPSAGAKMNGAPAVLIALPTDCFIMSSRPGEARSSTQC